MSTFLQKERSSWGISDDSICKATMVLMYKPREKMESRSNGMVERRVLTKKCRYRMGHTLIAIGRLVPPEGSMNHDTDEGLVGIR